MNEFGGGHFEEPLQEEKAEITPEVRAERAREAVAEIAASDYLLPGETLEIFAAVPGQKGKWAMRCELRSLVERPPNVDQNKSLPSKDPIFDSMAALGYRVEVWPGFESDDPRFDTATYFLHDTEK
jgi:hypothetical protein